MLTDKGLARLQLAEAFGLDAFFQEQVGNIVIADWEFTDKIRTRVAAFLRTNTDWVMGYELRHCRIRSSEPKRQRKA
mgnify:CR=1 FL=1